MATRRIRAVIVEDEPPAREKLAGLVADEPDFEVVGQFGSGDEAAAGISALRPEVVFLDIRIAGADGFEVLERIEGSHLPQVVFVTAHDAYAVRAFEVDAIDFLLKPFDRARLTKTLDRIRTNTPVTLDSKLDIIISRLEPEKHLRRLVVRDRERLLFVDVDEIRYLEGADNYVRVQTGAHDHLVRDTLTRLEQQLDPNCFVRIHKHAIVNLRFVDQMKPSKLGTYVLVLEDGTTLPVGRSYRDRLLMRTRVG